MLPNMTIAALGRSAVVNGRYYFKKTKEKYDKIQFNNLMVDALLFLFLLRQFKKTVWPVRECLEPTR